MEYNINKIKYEIAQKYHIPESAIDDSLIPLFKMVDSVLDQQKKVNQKYTVAIVLMMIFCTSLLLCLWLYFK
jgi:hypothetical protein